MTLQIQVDAAQLQAFCRKHYIRRLAFFGSALREDFDPASDVDVLVEFQSDHIPGLRFFEMEAELSRIIGRRVDLNTLGSVSPYIRSRVASEAQVAYVEA